jgi:hypothetical protein
MLASLLTSYSDITIFRVGNDRGTVLEAGGLGRIRPPGDIELVKQRLREAEQIAREREP